MNQPKGSIGVSLGVAAIIVIAITSLGYYQFVVCKPTTCSTSSATSSSASGPACAPPSCVTIYIAFGAALLTTTAYSPDVAKLVIGVNNTFQFYNNDSQSGGVFHSATADSCPKACPFDTGIIAYNITSGPYTITQPGTYKYYCEVHPTTMVGTIEVVAGSGAPPPASSSSSSSSASASSSAAANGVALSILKGAASDQTSLGFSPDNATVVIGTNSTITWTNLDSAGHTVYFTSTPSGAKVTNSPLIGPNETFTQVFTVPGTYKYICSIHPWMKGTIIVKSG